MAVLAALLFAAGTYNPEGTILDPRGAARFTCVTALLPENRSAAAEWIAGFWMGWDMAMVKEHPPLAINSDLNGIVGEVEKVCRDRPSTSLLFATLEARKAVKARDAHPPQ